MARGSVTLTGAPFAAQFQTARRAAMEAAGRRLGPRIVADVRAHISTWFGGAGRMGLTQRRLDRVRWEIRPEDGALVVVDTLRVQAIFETGGMIRPKKAQYLVVPFERYRWDHFRVGNGFSSGRKTRLGKVQRAGLEFIIKNRRGQLLVMRKTGKNTAVPVSILKTEVHIPALFDYYNTIRSWEAAYYAEVERQMALR